jgi:hypothetical protein
MTSSEPMHEQATGEASHQSPQHGKRHRWLKIGVPVVAAIIVVIALWIWVTLGFVYSSGERTGYVKSLAQRGWLCKTWEGQLSVVSPVPGTPQTTFDFTVRDDSLARALQLAAGHQVTLSYAGHKGIPTSCFGETEDFVQGFRVVR